MSQAMLMLPDGELAHITPRCFRQYVEIVRPALEGARRADIFCDMQRLVNVTGGPLELERPTWMHHGSDPDEWSGVPRWLMCGPDIAILVAFAANEDKLLATAVVARGSFGPLVRAQRNESKAAGRRAHRRRVTMYRGPSGRGPARRKRRDQLARDADARRDEP